MKMAKCHYGSTLVLAFLCAGPAAALTTLHGLHHTDGVVNAAMLALVQHDKPSTDDLEQVAGQLAQLAAAKISGEQMGVNVTEIANTIKGLVTTLKDETLKAVGDTQGILDGLHAKAAQCKKPADSQPQITILEAKQTSTSSAHVTCKSNLQTLNSDLTTCNALVTALKAQRDSQCATVLDGPNVPATDHSVCENSGSSEHYKDWVTRLAGFFDTKKVLYLENEAKCLDLRDWVTTNESHCSSLQNNVNSMQQQCASATADLNTAGCDLANTQAGVCHTYECCHSDTEKAYTIAKTNAESEEKAFVAQWEALAHIECIIGLMVQADVTSDKINSCLTQSVSTTPVELNYHTLPNKLPCTPPTVYPCEAAWKQQHQIGDSDICIPCQGIAATPCGSSGGTSPAIPVIPLGLSSVGVDASKCGMDGDWFKVDGVTCFLGNADGTPLEVDYTKKKYTRFEFKIKLGGDDNTQNYNTKPHGGFMPCNRDNTGTGRYHSPELEFEDSSNMWGWGTQHGSFGHKHEYRNLKGSSSDPQGMKELPFDVTLTWDGSSYKIERWKIADDTFHAYRGKNTGCNPSDPYGFVPKLWAWGGGSQAYMKDLVISQGDDYSAKSDGIPEVGNNPPGNVWKLVLQYGDSAYTPTAGKVGVVDESDDSSFAKLSDAEINNLDDGDDTYDYFMLTSEGQGTGNDPDVEKLFVRVLDGSFDDTAHKMGWGENYQFCSKIGATDFSECGTWETSTGRNPHKFDTDDHAGRDYGCNMWLFDKWDIPSCHHPTDKTKRCFTGGAHCKFGHHQIRKHFKLYKKVVSA